MRLALPERDQWRYVARIAVAVALAYLLTHGTDPANALYAVLGAGMVVSGNVGEGLGASRDRVVGTVIGAGMGIVLAAAGGASLWTLAAGSALASLAGIAIGGLGIGRIAFTVTAVTILVHPGDAAHYGLFRFTNTLQGVAVAIAVNHLLWPISGTAALEVTLRRVLRAAADLLGDHAQAAARSRLDGQRRLFRALAGIPKAAVDSRLDPLQRLRGRPAGPVERWGHVVAEIGVATLTLSIALTRLSPGLLADPRWPDLAAALDAQAARLRLAADTATAAEGSVAMTLVETELNAIGRGLDRLLAARTERSAWP